jgi:hypothetical protein
LEVNDENDEMTDSLVRSMDPRIRIRIHPKMSWIRNTGVNTNEFRIVLLRKCGRESGWENGWKMCSCLSKVKRRKEERKERRERSV